jgi:hypothetical protein
MAMTYKISTYADHVTLQTDLGKAELWCGQSGISLNVSKCFIETYQQVLWVQIGDCEVKNFGVTFDQKLAFTDHHASIISS